MLGLREVEIREIEDREGVKLSQRQGRPLFLRGNCMVRGQKRPIMFELDSGSDRCLIRKEEAGRLGVRLRRFGEPKNIVGVGGKLIRCEEYCILEMEIQAEEGEVIKVNVLCYIFESDVPNLLGNDLMGYMGVVIDYGEECLWVSGRRVRLCTDRKEAGRGVRVINFVAMSDECLEAKDSRKINVRMSGVPEGVFAMMGDHEGEVVVKE